MIESGGVRTWQVVIHGLEPFSPWYTLVTDGTQARLYGFRLTPEVREALLAWWRSR